MNDSVFDRLFGDMRHIVRGVVGGVMHATARTTRRPEQPGNLRR